MTGGFSCVNNRLAFDTQIILNNKQTEKVVFDLKIAGEKQTKRISSVLVKVDENNQYGQAMRKPRPYGCINRKEHLSDLMEFNIIFDKMSYDDKIRHLFIVDIKFHDKNPKTLLFNEIYPAVVENKNLDPYQRSCFQLVSAIKSNEEKDMTNSFSYSSKTHSTLEDNKFIPLYADHLHFLIKRVGWQVTKTYGHYKFEQAKIKNKCVVMNQKSR